MKTCPPPVTLAVALIISPILSERLPAELINYWPFDETEGETAGDVVGGADGIWQNPGGNLAWTTGITGGAADLGGQVAGNNYFLVNLVGRLVDAEGLTISMWAKPDGFTSDTYEGLFTTRSSVTGTAIGNANWGFSWENGNNAPNPDPHLDSRTGNGVDSTGTMTVGGGSNGGWHHVVLVWDGVAGMHTQYLNGVATTASGPVGTLSGGTWHIGHDDCCGGDRDFDGAVDDLAVWDEPLSEADVLELFNRTKTPLDISPPPDADDDGMPDSYEEMFPGFLDPNVPDADQDVDRVGGLPGGALMPDGLTNEEERAEGTDPTDPDTDGDTLLDGEEVKTYGSDPLSADPDQDNIPDSEEVVEGVDGYITDPNKADTDGDGINDDVEIANGTDPTNLLSPAPVAIPTTGLVALYTFDDGAGTTALDSATADGSQDGLENQGTIGWTTTGVIGGALDLNGSSSLQAPDALTAGTSAFTQTAWVYPRTRGGYKGIYATRVVNGAPNFNWGLNVELDPLQGDLRFATGNSTSGASAGIDTPAIPINQWSHLAITWTSDGFTATGNGYLNGQLIGTMTANLNPEYFSGAPYNIGDDPCCGGREFDGLIDDVGVWNVALSDDEIRAIYVRGLSGEGIPPSEPVDFRITSFERNPDGTVTLTWNSHPFPDGTPDLERPSYILWFNTDLTAPRGNWADDSDSIFSMGDTTTYTTINSFGNFPEVYFYVELNTASQ